MNILVSLPGREFALGGHEAVCFEIVDALQDDYNVDLLLNRNDERKTSIQELNNHFGTTVCDNTLIDNNRITAINFISSILNNRLIPELVSHASTKITDAAFIREYQSLRKNYDLVIDVEPGPDVGFRHVHSGLPHDGEGGSSDIYLDSPSIYHDDTPAIYYRHYAYKITKDRSVSGYFGIPDLIDRVCTRLVDVDERQDLNSVYIGNSAYTTGRLEDAYDIPITKIHPPVNIGKFENNRTPWSRRENGFVTVGRLSPKKNQLKTIRILDKIRDNGHDVHLHVVGEASDPNYANQVIEECEQRSFVTYEGKIPDEDLVDLLCTHKFGIHAKEFERFGIVIGEMVAVGMIPFVPDSGGQIEVVNHRPELTYDTVKEAARQFDHVFRNEDRQKRLRTELLDSVQEYSQESFAEKFDSLTTRLLHDSAIHVDEEEDEKPVI